MKKPIQISVPQPCHEDWNQMTPQELGRFCDACQKCVIDFTHMTDSQLYRFMKANEGKDLCGNFLSSQLDRQIMPPAPLPSRWYKWAAAAGLTLLFSQWPKGDAKAQPATTQTTPTRAIAEQETDSIVVKGVVVYNDFLVREGYVLLVVNGRREMSVPVTDGHFHFTYPVQDSINTLAVHYKEQLEAYGATVRYLDTAKKEQSAVIDILYTDMSDSMKERYKNVGIKSRRSVPTETIEKMGIRSTTNIASTVPGVYQSSPGGNLSIRGARTDGTLYIIDGVQVIPQKKPNFFQRMWGGIKNIFKRKD